MKDLDVSMIYGETNGVSDWHLELLKDYASIDDEYLHSVTFQEPQHEPLPDQIINIDECFPSEGQIFNSDDEAYEFYRLFARKNGFSIRREHVYNSVKHRSEMNPLGIYKREFVCHRSDIVKHRKTNEVDYQRNRKSSRCNCSAKMLVAISTIGIEEKWVVKYFNNDHNHELLEDKEV
jgi:hypothetical protein